MLSVLSAPQQSETPEFRRPTLGRRSHIVEPFAFLLESSYDDALEKIHSYLETFFSKGGTSIGTLRGSLTEIHDGLCVYHGYYDGKRQASDFDIFRNWVSKTETLPLAANFIRGHFNLDELSAVEEAVETLLVKYGAQYLGYEIQRDPVVRMEKTSETLQRFNNQNVRFFFAAPENFNGNKMAIDLGTLVASNQGRMLGDGFSITKMFLFWKDGDYFLREKVEWIGNPEFVDRAIREDAQRQKARLASLRKTVKPAKPDPETEESLPVEHHQPAPKARKVYTYEEALADFVTAKKSGSSPKLLNKLRQRLDNSEGRPSKSAIEQDIAKRLAE